MDDQSIMFADSKMKVEGFTNYKPLGNRVIGQVLKDPKEEEILNGIILPFGVTGGRKDPYLVVKVLKVGRGTITHNGIIPCEVVPGDTVMLFNSKWFELEEDGKKFIIFAENDIVAGHSVEQKA